MGWDSTNLYQDFVSAFESWNPTNEFQGANSDQIQENSKSEKL